MRLAALNDSRRLGPPHKSGGGTPHLRHASISAPASVTPGRELAPRTRGRPGSGLVVHVSQPRELATQPRHRACRARQSHQAALTAPQHRRRPKTTSKGRLGAPGGAALAWVRCFPACGHGLCRADAGLMAAGCRKPPHTLPHSGRPRWPTGCPAQSIRAANDANVIWALLRSMAAWRRACKGPGGAARRTCRATKSGRLLLAPPAHVRGMRTPPLARPRRIDPLRIRAGLRPHRLARRPSMRTLSPASSRCLQRCQSG